MKNKCAVIGCGVIGLTTAIRLQEAGNLVTIFARERFELTTSRIAAGLWMPYHVGPIDKVSIWGERAREVFSELAAVPESGVTIAPFRILLDSQQPMPEWMVPIENSRAVTNEDFGLPMPYGYETKVPLADTSVFLNYLWDRFESSGGKCIEQTLASTTQIPKEFQNIFNCSGVWAHDLVPDPLVHPIRGEVLVFERPKNMNSTMLVYDESAQPSYVIPRISDVICGGSAEVGNWSTTPNLPLSEIIRENAFNLAPTLRTAKQIAHRVGLRPGRNAVRLGIEKTQDDRRVIHNYGHGGAGITLCWGCAEEAASLL